MINDSKTSGQSKEIDLVQIVRVLWSKASIILLTGILIGGLFFGYARYYKTPKYEANVLFYVNNSTFSISNAMAITTGELSAAADLVDTYVAILQSRANMELILEQSGVQYTYEELRHMIKAKAVNSTGLFQISVTSGSPEEARTLANTIAAILPDKISDIVQNSSVEIVDYAVTPHQRISPSYSKYGAVGLLIGMVVCALIVLILDYMNDIIQSEDYLIQRYDAPLLASIPDLKKKSSKYGYYKK